MKNLFLLFLLVGSLTYAQTVTTPSVDSNLPHHSALTTPPSTTEPPLTVGQLKLQLANAQLQIAELRLQLISCNAQLMPLLSNQAQAEIQRGKKAVQEATEALTPKEPEVKPKPEVKPSK